VPEPARRHVDAVDLVAADGSVSCHVRGIAIVPQSGWRRQSDSGLVDRCGRSGSEISSRDPSSRWRHAPSAEPAWGSGLARLVQGRRGYQTLPTMRRAPRPCGSLLLGSNGPVRKHTLASVFDETVRPLPLSW